jgi:hypothetical protein
MSRVRIKSASGTLPVVDNDTKQPPAPNLWVTQGNQETKIQHMSGDLNIQKISASTEVCSSSRPQSPSPYET